MFDSSWMERIFFMGMIGVVVTVLAYLVLRMFVWSKAASKSLEYIRRHALWTGLIAWAFSSLAGAGQAGTTIYGQFAESQNPWVTIPWAQLLLPATAVIAVHAIGQATWPAPKDNKRTAVLEFRRVRDYVPPALGWTVLGIFLFSAAVTLFLATARGFEAVASPVPTARGLWVLGRIDGWVLALALSAALILLAAGTLLVMRLIASRRSLEALTPEQNKTLRIIGINRLLRVSATVASGLAAIAGNYLVQPIPGSDVMSYTNWLALFNMAVLITMLFWKPPALDTRSTPSPLGKALKGSDLSKLIDSTLVILVPAAVVGFFLGFALRSWLGWMGILSLSMIFMVLAYLLLELVLQRNYGTKNKDRPRHRVQLPAPLPRYAYAGLILSAIGLFTAVLYAQTVSSTFIPNRWDGFPAAGASYTVASILAVVMLLAGLAAAHLVRSRAPLAEAPAAFDRALRRRSLFRVARTVASCWFTLTGVLLYVSAPSASMQRITPSFDPTTLSALAYALALISFFLPIRSYADSSPSRTAQAASHTLSR